VPSKTAALKDLLDPRIARRDVFRVFAIGAAVVTTVACRPVEAEGFPNRRKAAYRVDSPDVQAFYRVNRYPAR
jgi:hypothetical protein